ncbi:MAG: peroxide stress protein YaaA [SAR86 cluster bacterium]|jgi:uncharacterized protein|nr:peroxide stress protein YaaA [SAR86 cluster bacterium]
MIIVIAPAKTLDYETDLPTEDYTIASHLSKTKKLIKELRLKDPDKLSSLMGISDKLAVLNFERNMNWSSPKKLSRNSRQALFTFKGDVYIGLEAYSMCDEGIKYAQKHLRILSGLYGLLKPLDLISPYRLEMGTKLEVGNHRNLYEFWGNDLTESINRDLDDQKNTTIVNLASVEYFSSINKENLSGKVVSPIFKDYKNGQYKIISFFAKKARGMMARFIIENKIDDLNGLNNFNVAGYKYNSKESTDLFPVFLRRQI